MKYVVVVRIEDESGNRSTEVQHEATDRAKLLAFPVIGACVLAHEQSKAGGAL